MRRAVAAMTLEWAFRLILAAAAWGGSLNAASSQEPPIGLLIRELASPEFEVRRLAQEQLQGLGLEAFDALLDAQFDPDVEVAHRARFILRSMAIEWVKESDPKDVKSILRNYGKADPIDRRIQIEALAQLEDQRGTAALCRLSNYEYDPVLSKYAALQIMQLELETAEAREAVRRTIELHCRPSKRPASRWLQTYRAWLADPVKTLDVWSEIVAQERQELEAASPNTSREMTGLLHLWYADALRKASREEESLAALRRVLDFLEPDERQVRDAAISLLARRAYPVVEELAAKFPDLFNKNPYLCYLHAESLQDQAASAGTSPPTEKIEALLARVDDLVGEKLTLHIELAEFLESRGRFDWFEREARIVLGRTPLLSDENARMRHRLAELLHDLERFDESVELMRPLAEELQKLVEGGAEDFLLARYHFFVARAALHKRDYAKQQEALKRAISFNIEDSDVIIEMFRAPETDEIWKELTLNYVRAASKKFDEELKALEADMVLGQGNEPFRTVKNEQIALVYNQYAWLISNTTGDFDRALEMSKRSLEIKPNYATYLDTLGRCYYAKKDYTNAVKYQRMAVKLKPFSPSMKRQLALFEEALKNSAPPANSK
jgi:tetratricopeptide (TPR) repeat protein